MSIEKIYYAGLTLLLAVSMLLSPFFYVRLRKTARQRPTAARWRKVWLANLLATLLVLLIWWWLRA
ncbi:hypothetical protein [Neisseria shayeganii]|uniref:Uncharacterized protein n=1 Tax=Neisseria shayeganii TaxID=607712 RepID=A0A7D7NGI5_9NEIS|nr:hypothetical protein [Neisseria shayeganii]QMT40894.1 hypothetical protein H3L94_02225 [Neisseria shayeganii]